MTLATEAVGTQQLSLPEELILMLLNEESGYFRQIAGWDLNYAVAGAALAELSLLSRIDTDMESLFLLDDSETGDPALDPILKEIAAERIQRNAQYWIERLAPRAERIIDLTLGRLVDLEILDYHEGDYWTLSSKVSKVFTGSGDDTALEFVKARIANVIFNDEILDPRDIIIVSLVNTCDVFRFIFMLDEEAEQRIELVCKMDLIARAIGEALAENLVGPHCFDVPRCPSRSQLYRCVRCCRTHMFAMAACSRCLRI